MKMKMMKQSIAAQGAKGARVAQVQRRSCYCAATKQNKRGGAQNKTAANQATGNAAFEEVDSAFGAIKDWNGNLEDFKMETDFSKLVGGEELAGKREEFEKLLETYSYNFQPGDRMTGLILNVGKRGATVEIGAKLPAFCPLKEASVKMNTSLRSTLVPGTEREFEVLDVKSRGESLIVSARNIESELCWKRVMQLYQQNAVVSVKIKTTTRGGGIVELENIQGFIPKSHMGMDMEKAKGLIGKSLVAKFLEADPETNRLVLSHRMANAQNNVKDLEVGSVVKGKIVAVKDYGAFVDLGLEFNALLHVSQISYNRLFTVDQVLSVGDEIKAMVLSYDANRGRVSLSTKKLEMEPGDMLRNPAKVFDNAENMAKQFRERVAAAEAVARASSQEAEKEDKPAAEES